MRNRNIVAAIAFLCSSAFAHCQQHADTSKPLAFNIVDYGAVADGKTLNTIAIQKTVNACKQHGGGTIVIPAGHFVTGTVNLCSNIDFYLEAGSFLIGSRDNKDYQYQKGFGFTGLGAGNKTGILVAHDEQNISISGFGTITGNGVSFMYMDSLQYGMDFKQEYTRQKSDYMNPKYGRDDGPVLWKGSYEERPGVMVIFSDCKKISIRDIHLEDAPNWTVAFSNSEDIKVDAISVLNNMSIPNSDGIDLYDSKNVAVSNCHIQVGDDAIAVISSNNITVTNCILHSRSSGIRVGYNVYNHNNTTNLLFNNITIYDSNRGIGIFQRQQGDMAHMIFSNITINTRLHSGQWWGHGEPIHISVVPGLGSTQTGSVSDVRFSNIVATSESGILLYSASPHLIHDISFDNINLSIIQSHLAQGYGGNIDLRPTNDVALGIFKHSIPAFYSLNADNLSIKGMVVHWAAGLPDYFTHAVECEHSDHLSIDDLQERADDDRHASNVTVYLHRGKMPIVKNVSSTDRQKKLIVNDVTK